MQISVGIGVCSTPTKALLRVGGNGKRVAPRRLLPACTDKRLGSAATAAGNRLAARRQEVFGLPLMDRPVPSERFGEIESVVGRFDHTGKRPTTDGRLGLQVVEMLEAATRSMAMRGHPVEFGGLRRAS